MKAPWMADRSEANCRRVWESCVGFTRECLGDHPRYREVSFEGMLKEPVAASAELFEWLGISTDEEVLRTVKALSRERFSEHGAVQAERRSGAGPRQLAKRAKARARRTAQRVGLHSSDSVEAVPDDPVSFEFVRALRERDLDLIAQITTDSVALTYRSANGDLCVRGDAARQALGEMAAQLFEKRHISEWWGATEGGPRTWWSRRPGVDFRTIFFSGIGGGATRVDLAFGLTPEDGLIDEVLIISAGGLMGRPLRELGTERDAKASGAEHDDLNPADQPRT
jgi:hypothetical protein